MDFSLMSFLTTLNLLIVCVAIIGRYGSFLWEPEMPIKTPFGKLPFFDGIIVYGIVMLFLLMLLEAGISR